MIECHTDGRATRAGDVEAKNFKRADGSGATKKPKEDGLEDRGPKGGERQLTQSVAEKTEWVAEARGRRAQEGRDTILAEALGAALPLHHC